MTLLRKITVSILVLAALVLVLREFGVFNFQLYSSQSSFFSSKGPQGKYTSFPMESLSIERVREFGPPAQSSPKSAEIQVIMAGDFPLTTWLPFYKFGKSTVVAVYRVSYEGLPIGDTFSATVALDQRVTGLCSQRGYRELAFESAEASITDHVEKVLKRPSQ